MGLLHILSFLLAFPLLRTCQSFLHLMNFDLPSKSPSSLSPDMLYMTPSLGFMFFILLALHTIKLLCFFYIPLDYKLHEHWGHLVLFITLFTLLNSAILILLTETVTKQNQRLNARKENCMKTYKLLVQCTDHELSQNYSVLTMSAYSVRSFRIEFKKT